MTIGLTIIDMQNDFVLPEAPACIPNAHATIPAIRLALDFFRRESLPIFHIIRNYRPDGSDIELTRRAAFLAGPKYALPGTRGAEIVSELAPLPGEHVIVKPRFSAFMGTEFDLVLRRCGVTHLAICGTQYPNCIRATAFDSISYGYPTTILVDATSAATQEVALGNIRDMQAIGIECIPFQEFAQKIRPANPAA